ncbi:MAG: c-type cytochrome [Bacteroidetes bacterium]|nr:c-type cytochrome [Bacteroidota bacterium]
MKKNYLYIIGILTVISAVQLYSSCSESKGGTPDNLRPAEAKADSVVTIDTTKIPDGKYGDAVRYGRQLMLHTAYYIGPDGVNGHYTNNKMNCTNCHQDAGTKAFSLNLVTSFRNYPSYRAREGKVLSLADRINNCIMHPHLGKPLPLDSKEMIGFMSYLKWLCDSARVDRHTLGLKNVDIDLPDRAASPVAGAKLYAENCARCHGDNGQGKMRFDNATYQYPPLWGLKAYQPGSSMHRIVKEAQWLVSNMPYDKATHDKPYLTSAQALDIAAFINDDKIHQRPPVKEFQYPNAEEKAIDYDRGPFKDPFSEQQHKFGPFKPIVEYWKSKGANPGF